LPDEMIAKGMGQNSRGQWVGERDSRVFALACEAVGQESPLQRLD
jgi:hypothetical protein